MEAEDEVSGCLSYKQLYHASVERSGNLQEHLGREYSQLLAKLGSKHMKITELKENAISSLNRNKNLLDTYHKDIVQKENEWREKMDEYLLKEQKWEQECQGLRQKCHTKEAECRELTQQWGRALGRAAIARAESKAKDSLLEAEKTRVKSETDQVKRQFSKYSRGLQHKYKEVKEALEFSEIERAAIAEANAELESQINRLTAQTEERTKSLEHAQAQLNESKCENEAMCAVVPVELAGSATCTGCQNLCRRLGVAVAALNSRGCAKYGDLLHSNFVLEQKLKAVESQLSGCTQVHQTVVDYFQEYKVRSIEKVGILKENIQKADLEVVELDRLIEMVRKALHGSMDLVRQSPHLLKALEEIDGTDSDQVLCV